MLKDKVCLTGLFFYFMKELQLTFRIPARTRAIAISLPSTLCDRLTKDDETSQRKVEEGSIAVYYEDNALVQRLQLLSEYSQDELAL